MGAVMQKGARKSNSQRGLMRGSVSRRRVRWDVCLHDDVLGGDGIDIVVDG